ncbi:hypothetical protein [Streptomyces sp. cmx-4-9]|uniref:hypothetical protein n=1 Tax=Streptomyces sp. cmx-4-9 TaxID=2790941 RepID=UPI00397EFC16
MTRRHGPRRPAAGGRPDPVDQWFDRHGRALADALGDVLDVEAGLREVLVQSRHDEAEGRLEAVLDVEAGLGAIVLAAPPPSFAPSPSPSTGREERGSAPHPRTAAQEFLHSVSPADRLAARAHPEVTAAGRALDRAVELIRRPDGGHAVLERAVDLARDLALDLSRARDLDFDIVLSLDPELGRGLRQALESTGPLGELGLPGAAELERDLAIAQDLNLARARGLDTARARARDLTRVLDLARLLAVRLVGADSGPAEHADQADRADQADQAASDLAGILVGIRTEQVGRALALVLRREPPPLDEDAALTFLHDFTAADLRAAELKGVDLGGVHWSEYGTRWPAALDVDELRQRSVEAPAGSHIWVVRWGGAEFREFATL